MLLILCLQIVRDAHFRQKKLKQVYDIAQLINNRKLNWKLLIQLAKDSGNERLLLFGLAIACFAVTTSLPLLIKH